MDKIIDYLKQLDLSDAEAKIYLRLLQSGPTSVRDLAQTVEIKRTTAYFYIDQLVEKGLIMKLVRGSKKLVAANEPHNLRYLVEEKVDSARIIEKSLPSILKTLSTSLLKGKSADDAEIRFYKGISNARKSYEESLHANELRTYARIDKTINLFPDSVKVFKKAFKSNLELKIWEIIYDSESSSEPAEHVKANTDRYFYKKLPNHLKLSSEDILLYDGRVAILNFREGGSNIVLKSADFYSNFKQLFDFMWQII
jgi:sugar-specific transcriptional regulator TrmB